MIVCLDFETYYASDYSLSQKSMTDTAYILDPRFEIIMCAVQEGDGPNECFVGYDAVAERLARIDWDNAALLAQNTRFDGAILYWHFGHLPKLFLDTMAMAKALIGSVSRVSLEAVARYLGLPPKGDEVVRAIGKRLCMFTAEELYLYAQYCLNDNMLCKRIFDILRPVFPTMELAIIDWTLRMFIVPQVTLDAHVLAEHLGMVRVERAQCFERVASYDRSIFSSNVKFPALLAEYGVEVPMKISPATGELIPALAKGDRAFKELLADDTQPPMVQALLAARVAAKSTIEETRTEKMLNLALHPWPDGSAGWMPVPLRYCAAHTTRWGGDAGFNFQNLKRASRIRAGIRAPHGWRIVHRDASQIEARMVAWLAGCHVMLQAFRNNEDIYCKFASMVFGRVITRLDVLERFLGKTAVLGLGYGMSAVRFLLTLFLGTPSVTIELALGEKIVATYRDTYREVPFLWATFSRVLYAMLARAQGNSPIGFERAVPSCLIVEDAAIRLPNGLAIAYPDLQFARALGPTGVATEEITYADTYGQRVKIYGAKVLENVSQGLSRVVIGETAARVRHDTGWWPFLTTHDSLDYCVPEEEVEAFDAYLDGQFAVVPSWARGLPLASEGGWGITLADAEAKVNN